MLKLLLRKKRYELRREFFYRFVNIFLMFTISGLIITDILFFAPYILVRIQKNVITNEVEALKKSENAVIKKELNQITTGLAKEFEIFKRETPKYSEIIEQINKDVSSGITLKGFSLDRATAEIEGETKDVLKISLTGEATSRRSLVNYTELLKKRDSFYKVDLPLSNLTKDANILFNIKLVTNNLAVK